MPGEELNPNSVDDLAREMERALDERVVSSLESLPDLSASIPADFAARVAAKVPARQPVPVLTTHYGRTVMWCCLAVLFVALVVVAAKGLGHSAIGTAVELTLYAQFLAIVVWLGVRRWRAN
jgi:hypothetical protein